jgi:hypothetical protein
MIVGTPLDAAAGQGHTATVRLLPDTGAGVHREASDRDILGDSTLYPDVLKLLLDRGADINFVKAKSRDSPLHHAAANGDTESVRLLVDRGAHINPNRSDGATPLKLAVIALAKTPTGRNLARSYEEIIDILKAHGGITGDEEAFPEPKKSSKFWK